ncbi:hypothetical protein BDFB_015048 [Asbolus verrucosus]|uniref:Uncharacterized protein n=1 Tax=Asbolus verrucosus TaxID=1661398 RepID=A0A482V8U0_ASBVE|nr:hypothetical protein BDFB_015048 [Asbolus verrucosus]
MTPLDFFLWGVLKERVYSRPILNREHLGNRIVEECADIMPETLDRDKTIIFKKN